METQFQDQMVDLIGKFGLEDLLILHLEETLSI
jgi:hypothetical protein